MSKQFLSLPVAFLGISIAYTSCAWTTTQELGGYAVSLFHLTSDSGYLNEIWKIGIIMPLMGAALFGAIADRRPGVLAMASIVALASVALICTGLLPSPTAFGSVVPIAFFVLLSILAMATRGALGVWAHYLAQLAPPGRRSMYISWLPVLETIADYYSFKSVAYMPYPTLFPATQLVGMYPIF